MDSVFAVEASDPVSPKELPAPSPRTGEVIALLVEPRAQSHGWAGRLAVHLANRWAGEDVQVTLADGDLDRASLHHVYGLENGEGVSDVILYGASNSRVSQQVEGNGPFFVPAGTVVSDPEAIYRDSRWSNVLHEIRASGTVLLLYLPADSEGASDLAGEADRVVRLASDAPPDGLSPPAAWIHVSGGDADGVDAAPRERTAGAVGAVVEESSPTSVPARKGTPRPKIPRPVLITLIVLLVVLIAVVWLGLIEIPGLTAAAPSLDGSDPFAGPWQLTPNG